MLIGLKRSGPTGAVARFLRALLGVVLLVAGPGGPVAAQDEAGADAGEVETSPVRVDGRVLLSVTGTSSRPAAVRAEGIAERVRAAAADPAIPTSAIRVVPAEIGLEIRAGNRPLMYVTSRDAQVEGMALDLLAEVHRRQIAEFIERYRAERTPERLGRGALVSAGATVVLLLAIMASSWLFRRLDVLIAARHDQVKQAVLGKAADSLGAAPLLRVMHRSLVTARIVVAVLLVLVWFDVVLGQFPWTRPLSENFAALLLDPLRTIGTGIADYIPNLLFLVVLAVVARFSLRLLRLYFGAVERGSVSLPNFEREWSLATYKIIRVVVIAIALVMAYPYLPGAGSEALQGLSVFAGLLISLGASSSVANVIAGYITTFGRVLRVGDMIQVGEVRGVVTQIRLLTVRLRTIRNEEVTIPNATLLGANVVNFSALSREKGLILQTEVGIGYEVPWRQVHAMLLEAARRTPGLMTEPAPFVLQRQLGDFAVVYQLNVYKAEAQGMVHAYSGLHQNILDVFNEYGVQIMTPAYEGDPESPKVVPREQWHQAPASPPAPDRGRG